jgi:hypothetical protein
MAILRELDELVESELSAFLLSAGTGHVYARLHSPLTPP